MEEPKTKQCAICIKDYPIGDFCITRKTDCAEYRHNLCRLCMNEKIRQKRLSKTPLIPKGFEKLDEETQTFLKENIKLRKYTLKELAEKAGVAYGSLLYWKKKGKLPED